MCSERRRSWKKASAITRFLSCRHDFPLPNHPWSLQAPSSRAFSDQTVGRETGNQFRDYMFSNQTQINLDNLRRMLTHSPRPQDRMPFVEFDPQGKLAAQVTETEPGPGA